MYAFLGVNDALVISRDVALSECVNLLIAPCVCFALESERRLSIFPIPIAFFPFFTVSLVHFPLLALLKPICFEVESSKKDTLVRFSRWLILLHLVIAFAFEPLWFNTSNTSWINLILSLNSFLVDFPWATPVVRTRATSINLSQLRFCITTELYNGGLGSHSEVSGSMAEWVSAEDTLTLQLVFVWGKFSKTQIEFQVKGLKGISCSVYEGQNLYL